MNSIWNGILIVLPVEMIGWIVLDSMISKGLFSRELFFIIFILTVKCSYCSLW